MAMPDVIGHTKILSELQSLYQRQAVPGAMIFIGPEGVGRKLVALRLAAALICSSGKFPACGHCDECRCIQAGSNPDCIVVDCKDSETWSTQGVRALLSKLSLRPFGSRARVVIMDQVEELQIQALNALLKTLEEPRAGNYFILLASNVANVPTTVVSRCQRWLFNSLTREEHSAVLSSLRSSGVGIELSDELLYEIGDGTLLGLSASQQVAELWEKLPGVVDEVFLGKAEVAVQFSAQFGKDRDGAVHCLRLVQLIARKKMLKEQEPILRYHWSMLLTNAVSAPRLINERYLSPSLVLSTVLLTVLKAGQVKSLIGLEYPKLIEEIVQ